MQQPRQVYRITNKKGGDTKTPNANDVQKKLTAKEDAYIDSEGRIYMLVSSNNAVLKNLENEGHVDNYDTFLMVVWLQSPIQAGASKELGVKLSGPDRAPKNSIPQGLDLYFAEVGSEIELRDFYTKNHHGNFTVDMYPEKIRRGAKSASVVLRVTG